MAKSRPQTRLNSRLSAVATPLALVGKDRRVLFFNQACERLTGWDRLDFPTLLWFGASDGVLTALCITGIALGTLAACGFLPRAALAGCWVLYLSLCSVGSPFLDFQWDTLLLEAGLLAVLFAPGGLRPFGRTEREPAGLARWLVYGLIFKLMVLSGAVKLLSGDESWLDGSALDFHYWTQPLPHGLSVVAAEAPAWFQHTSVFVMFVIEIGLPCLLLVPIWRRRLRQIVAAGVVFLMAAVFLTGNYGFFNLLTAVLCIPLLDDRAWRVLFRWSKKGAADARERPRWRAFLAAAIATPILLISATQLLVGFEWMSRSPAPIAALEARLRPLRSVNPYGLFRVMTRERPEIAIEGSHDGVTWEHYRFRYKPDELERAPVFAGLHMPRLDWQLWFVGLEWRRQGRSRWTVDLLERLLQGSPPVLGLLAENPFPGAPPRFVRATVAPYRFADADARTRGEWWARGESTLFLPVQERPEMRQR
jgi:hypothetical protein